MVEVDLEAALEIADTHGIYAYDAYVIGTALRQDALYWHWTRDCCERQGRWAVV
jgi:hypothetical protein